MSGTCDAQLSRGLTPNALRNCREKAAGSGQPTARPMAPIATFTVILPSFISVPSMCVQRCRRRTVAPKAAG